MKGKILKTSFLILIAFGLLTSFTFKKKTILSHYLIEDVEMCYHVPNKHEVNKFYNEEPTYYLFLGKSYVGFREALGFKESQGIYDRVNRFGYMGKYQFAKSTLNMLGVYDTSNFLYDAELQENAMTAYMSKNKWILRREIKRYVGSHMNGVKVTESGILAAAHLAGAGNVKTYLRSGGKIGFSDAFGTSIRYYLKKFSGYDTSFIVAEKSPKVI
jgi:hypothetical protein